MRGFNYHGWSCGAVSKWRLSSRIVLILAAGVLLSGCSGKYDILGRPMIIDASKRQASEETIVATRSGVPTRTDVRSSNQTAPNGPYRVARSENRQNQFSGPTNRIGAGRQTTSPSPMGNSQQAYNGGGYTPGQSGQQLGGYNPTPRDLSYNQQQGTMGSMEQNSYPHSYASRPGPSISQGYSPVNPNAATVGRRQNRNYDRRQSPTAGNYPPTITGTNHQLPGGGLNQSRVISLNPPASYGRSTNGMPEVSGVSVTEVPPLAAVETQNIGTHTNNIAPSTAAVTTGVEPGNSNGGFSSNSTAAAPSLSVPNPSRPQAEVLQPAVSVHPAGYSPDQIGIVNAIAELEKYQGTNNYDLHTSLALYLMYLNLQQPEKANLFLSDKNEEQANRMLELLDYARDKVAPRADFVISCMKICDKVSSFGNYQEIKPAKLQSGKSQKVYVYCELENFESKLNAQGQYISDIDIKITLFDSHLNTKCQKAVPVDDTPSYSRRRDFFLIGDLTIPMLSPGKYWLRVEVEDKIAGKRAKQKEIVFEVKATKATTLAGK